MVVVLQLRGWQLYFGGGKVLWFDMRNIIGRSKKNLELGLTFYASLESCNMLQWCPSV